MEVLEIDARGPKGNAYEILLEVKLYLKRTGRNSEWSAVKNRMTRKDYTALCNIAEEVTNGAIKIVNRTDGSDWPTP